MGRRNREHTVKISKMENGKITIEEILCGSLAEALDVANRHNEHIVEIHDQIKTLVHYVDNIGEELTIEITEEPVTDEAIIETTVPELTIFAEAIIEEAIIESSVPEVITQHECVITESTEVALDTQVVITKECVITDTIPTTVVETPVKKTTAKRAPAKKVATK